VTSGKEALLMIEDQNVDVAVVDFAMPGINGIETLKQIKEKRSDIEVIMLTGQGTIQSAIEAMKHGAIDYLEKPVDLNILMEKIHFAKKQRMSVLEKKSADEVKNILKSKSW
jgi:DNA-binding NtrC family response regulator